MKNGSILSALKAREPLDLEALREQAASKFKPNTKELTDEAIKEARDHFFNPTIYKQILTGLQNTKLNDGVITKLVLKQYHTGIIDLEKAYKERDIEMLISLYPDYKQHMDTERLLLLNPIGFENSSTTFVHELFLNNSSKKNIIHFFKELNKLAELNPDIMSNYLALCDTDGKSIRQLLEEKSLKQQYLGIAEEIKRSCIYLYPNTTGRAHVPNLAIDTHTGSVHGSVDKSLSKLALNYDSNLVVENYNKRSVLVDRTTEWKEKIDKDFEALEQKLKSITSNDESIAEFIESTLEKGEDRELACKKFKFQAETALRMIDGLNSGGYGNHYRVSANEEVTCGLSPKEIVAIGYASLENRDLWNNPEKETQQFMQYIENLYIAKRGYNIDSRGVNEWNREEPEVDHNKCTGGTINQIAYGLTDNKLVEVKVITYETMKPALSVKLPDILGKLASSDKHKTLINNWLNSEILDGELINSVLTTLKEDEDFSKEFNQHEINNLGAPVLNKLNKKELALIQEKLQSSFPEIFPDIASSSELLSDKELAYNFIFEKNKGYVPYLEFLYYENQDRFFKALIQKMKDDITINLYSNDARKTNLMLNLLLSSQDEHVTEITKSIFNGHLKTFDQEIKNQYLILMAEQRHLNLLLPLVEAGASVQSVDQRDINGNIAGNTALHNAARNPQIDIIDKLVQLGADINSQNGLGDTALHIAIRSSQIDVISKLIDLGINIHTANNEGSTALHIAAEMNNTALVTKLIDLGINIHTANKAGSTALHIAAKMNNADLVTKLLDLGLNINERGADGKTILHMSTGNPSLIHSLLERGADVTIRDNEDNTALHSAAITDNPDLIDELVAKGAGINDKNKYHKTALHIALQHSESDTITKIIELGADIHAQDIQGNSALHIASQNSKFDAINILLTRGVNIDTRTPSGNTALHFAAKTQNIALIEELLKLGADINARGADGKTILHMCINLTNRLIDKGADITIRDNNNNTILHSAAALDRSAYIIPQLIRLDLDINAKNNDGDTALHIAVKNNRIDTIAKLIEQGADINAVNNIGNGPLHNASKIIPAITDNLIRNNNISAITNIIRQINSEDAANEWNLVKSIIKAVPKQTRVEIISGALSEAENNLKHKILLELLSSEEQSIAKAQLPQNVLEKINEIARTTQKTYQFLESRNERLNKMKEDKKLNR